MSRSKPRGAWASYPEPSDPEPVGELTLAQICAAVDKILAEDRSRVHRFPWAEGKETIPPEITILPHGARLIKMHFPPIFIE